MPNNRSGIKSLNFVGKFKIFLTISVAIILLGAIVNIAFGTELDVDFKGGTILTYSYENELDTDQVAAIVKEQCGLDVDVSESENYTSGIKSVVLTVAGDNAVSTEKQTEITQTLQNEFADNNIASPSMNSVAPSVGWSFFGKSMYALALAAILVIIYVGIRFRNIGGISAAITALIALVHDCAIAYFADVIFRIPLDDNFIAVELTILGYSLNDTIVIYYRIRENTKIYGTSMSHRELVNLSITQSLRRSLVTSIATFIAISTITVVAAIAGLESILSFSIPMSIGVIAGSFSSICLAGPLYVLWLEFKDRHNIGKKKKGKSAYAKKGKAAKA